MKKKLKSHTFLTLPHLRVTKLRGGNKKRNSTAIDHNDNFTNDDTARLGDDSGSDDGGLDDCLSYGGSLFDLRRVQSDLRMDRRPSSNSAISFRSMKV